MKPRARRTFLFSKQGSGSVSFALPRPLLTGQPEHNGGQQVIQNVAGARGWIQTIQAYV